MDRSLKSPMLWTGLVADGTPADHEMVRERGRRVSSFAPLRRVYIYMVIGASPKVESMVSELVSLRAQFPGFDIWLEENDSAVFIARRRYGNLHPHTLVTSDSDEMRLELTQDRGEQHNRSGQPRIVGQPVRPEITGVIVQRS